MQQFPAYFNGYENHAPQQVQHQDQQSQSQPSRAQDLHQQQGQPQPLLTGPNLAIYSPAAMQPLSVLAAAQRKDQDPNDALSAVTSVVSGGPIELGAHGKPKRKQVKNACVNCQKACKKCDIGRPCQRCVKYGITETCINSVRKERKKGIKRGPYKKRTKTGIESGASSAGSTPNLASPMANTPIYGNGVRPAALPMHYQTFSHGPYDPYAAYTNNGQMMPQTYMVPASIQQMYPTNPPVMSYQAAMNIISPQHQQQAASPNQQQQQPQQQQHHHQQQHQQHAEQHPDQGLHHPSQPLADQKSNIHQTKMGSLNDTTASSNGTSLPHPSAENKTEDDDDEGSKLNILSRLCSAVLDRNDTPKQEQEMKADETTSSTLSQATSS
ncbi:hypothetical protein BY458DRAFT_516125 [Sporodiniella umbellata]|nr:hypothetical protein BY458DRAFT_516125 [Sporodiniella umbellata]